MKIPNMASHHGTDAFSAVSTKKQITCSQRFYLAVQRSSFFAQLFQFCMFQLASFFQLTAAAAAIVIITSGYAMMVHGRGCNPHRCTTTFSNLEITSL